VRGRPQRTDSSSQSVAVGRTIPARLNRYEVVVFLGAALYLWLNLFAGPATPFLLGGDQVFFWLDAQRLLHGERVYRDFFQFTPPGTDWVYWSAFRAFGPRIWVTNLLVMALGLAFCPLCWRICRSIMAPARAALATALFLVPVYGKLLNGTHHWFSVLAVMGAVAVLLEGRSLSRIALAGVLLGVATFFTQTRGPVAALGIAIWLLSQRFRTGESWSRHLKYQALLCAALAVTWFALSGYDLATVGLRQLWYFQVTYVRQFKLSGWSPLSFATVRELLQGSWSELGERVFAYLIVPAVYLGSLWKCWKLVRAGATDNAARVALLISVGIAMFVEVSQSPSWFRVYCVALPAVLLLVWLVGDAGKLARYGLALLWIAVAVLAGHQTRGRHAEASVIVELPAGKAAMRPAAAEKLQWLAARTQPGQFLLQVGWSGVYLPLAVYNPLFLDDIDTGDARGAQMSIDRLEAKHVQYVLWSQPADSSRDSVPIFRNLLEKHYRKAWRFSDGDEVWQREP
jgi:hypothetical protein